MSLFKYSFEIQSAVKNTRDLLSSARTKDQIDAVQRIATELLLTEAGEDPTILALYDQVSRKRSDIYKREEIRAGRGKRSFFPKAAASGVPRKVAAARKRDPQRTARKRQFAAMSILPPHVSSHFTEGERAALFIIAEDIRKNGTCRASAQEIADRAGVGMTTVRNAYREAKRIGLLAIEERAASGRRGKHLPNIYRILCPVWKKWISSPANATLKAVKIATTLENKYINQYDFFKNIAERRPEYQKRRRTG